MSTDVFTSFPFGFEGRIWDLIVSVPDNCLSFYCMYFCEAIQAQQYMMIQAQLHVLIRCTTQVVCCAVYPRTGSPLTKEKLTEK